MLALLVVLHHSLFWNSSSFLWSRNLPPVLDFFFLLSGFVLAMVYGDRIRDGRSFADFFVRRAGRLWPVHLAVLGVLVALEVVQAIRAYVSGRSDTLPFSGSKSLGSALENVFLVHAWGDGKPFTWNVPSWTLSAELIAYALLGVILVGVAAKPLRIVAAVLVMTCSSALLAYQTDFFSQAANVSVAWCLQGFFAGYVLYHVWRGWPLTSRRWASVVELSLLIACVVMLTIKVSGAVMLAWLACSAALLHAVASGRGVVSDFLRLPPMQWLGQISLSVYLTHFPLSLLLYRAMWFGESRGWMTCTPDAGASPLGSTVCMDAFTLAYFVIALALGALVYHWVEVPARNWSAALAGRIGRGEHRLPSIVRRAS